MKTARDLINAQQKPFILPGAELLAELKTILKHNDKLPVHSPSRVPVDVVTAWLVENGYSCCHLKKLDALCRQLGRKGFCRA
jgi:hypothetical protein